MDNRDELICLPKWDSYAKTGEWFEKLTNDHHSNKNIIQFTNFVDSQLCAMYPLYELDKQSWKFLVHIDKPNTVLIVMFFDGVNDDEYDLPQDIKEFNDSLTQTCSSETNLTMTFTENFGAFESTEPIPFFVPPNDDLPRYFFWREVIIEFDQPHQPTQVDEINKLQDRFLASLNALPRKQ